MEQVVIAMIVTGVLVFATSVAVLESSKKPQAVLKIISLGGLAIVISMHLVIFGAHYYPWMSDKVDSFFTESSDE